MMTFLIVFAHCVQGVSAQITIPGIKKIKKTKIEQVRADSTNDNDQTNQTSINNYNQTIRRQNPCANWQLREQHLGGFPFGRHCQKTKRD
jgi:hypothetical protein